MNARETPVEDKCIWCKIPQDEWANGISPIALDTGEILCTECLRDVRSYKRKSTIQIRISSEYSPFAKQIIRDALGEAAEKLKQLNADDERLNKDPYKVHNAKYNL